ncbi:MAG: phenylacetyl CoA [Rhodospirillales bacterium]|nr:phenylacetyl CoA [Rhodospirillales bacterium]
MSGMRAARRQGHWDLRAAGNFIGGGAGTGLLLAAALSAAMGAAFRLPLTAGLVLIAAGLSLVWLEIGRPWRALNVFFHPRTSWMTREGIMAGLTIPLGVAALATDARPLVLAAALAGCGFLVCQAGILRAARAIPAWRRRELAGVILAAGAAEGAGLALLLPGAPRAVLILALAAGVAREAAWSVYRVASGRDPAAAGAVAAFAAPPARIARTAQWIGLVLLALAVVPGVPAFAMAGGVLAFLAGAAMKAVLITRAGFTRAIALPAIPTRGGGGDARPVSAR